MSIQQSAAAVNSLCSEPLGIRKMDFQSSKEVLETIVSIFPEFKAEWEADNPYIVDDKFSVHSVYMTFLPFLAPAKHTEKQMNKVASFINSAVLAGGDSENAVLTCFFKHVSQVGLTSTLKPLLTKEAKAWLHA